MQIITYDKKFPALRLNSLFLAGPTPRDRETPSWRPEAIRILEQLHFDGIVIVPEFEVVPEVFDYDTMVEWEHEGLTTATQIVFWVPRELTKMPAFTTNIEFGRFAHQDNVWYGRPDNAPKNRYLDWYFKKCHPTRHIYGNLKSMLLNVAEGR